MFTSFQSTRCLSYNVTNSWLSRSTVSYREIERPRKRMHTNAHNWNVVEGETFQVFVNKVGRHSEVFQGNCFTNLPVLKNRELMFGYSTARGYDLSSCICL